MRTYLWAAIALTIALQGTFIAPVEVDVVIRYFHASAATSGLVVTAELLALALVPMLIARYLRIRYASSIAIISVTIALGAQLGSAISPSVGIFAANRFVGGCACGALYALGCFWAALSSSPVRVLSIALMVASAIYGLAMFYLPALAEVRGIAGLFGPLAALTLVGILVTLMTRRPESNLIPNGSPCSSNTHNGRSMVVLLVGIALANLGLEMIWSFAEQIARSHRIALGSVGIGLALSAFATVAGSLCAGVLGARFGLRLPLITGASIGALGSAVVTVASDSAYFSAGMALYGWAYFFLLPYQISAAATLDGSPRGGAIGGAVAMLLTAVAPAIGGLIAQGSSVETSGWASVIACVAAIIATGFLEPDQLGKSAAGHPELSSARLRDEVNGP